jgi:hypothetical protein
VRRPRALRPCGLLRTAIARPPNENLAYLQRLPAVDQISERLRRETRSRAVEHEEKGENRLRLLSRNIRYFGAVPSVPAQHSTAKPVATFPAEKKDEFQSVSEPYVFQIVASLRAPSSGSRCRGHDGSGRTGRLPRSQEHMFA